MKIVLSSHDYVQLKYKAQMEVAHYLSTSDHWVPMQVDIWASNAHKKQFSKIQIQRKADKELNKIVVTIGKNI